MSPSGVTTKVKAAALTPEDRKKVAEADARFWAGLDLEIKHNGSSIVLPDDPKKMPLEEAGRTIARAIEQANKVHKVDEPINLHFFDGLVCLAFALKEKYGFVATDDRIVQSFFGPVNQPPKFINIKYGPGENDVVQAPFGRFTFPGIEAQLQTEYGSYKGIPVVRLTGEVKAKDKDTVIEVVRLAQQIAKTHSIYRGKSVILQRDDQTNGIELNEPLDFFDPHAGKEIPIFNRPTERLIDVAVMGPINHSAACRRAGIPLKRGILFEGPYGTGKSLTARQVARAANENGWTFLLVKEAKALRYALSFAKLYQPCVVFTEDIDEVVKNRNEGANSLINEIDGVVGKNDEIITVLTTNFPGKIDKALLRPGRLDAVVSITAPDPEAVERLIRYYAGENLDTETDLKPVGERLAGQIPATIREVVERSRLGMVVDGRTRITNEDMLTSAESMARHLKLIEEAPEGNRESENLTAILGGIVRDATTPVVKDILKKAGFSV